MTTVARAHMWSCAKSKLLGTNNHDRGGDKCPTGQGKLTAAEGSKSPIHVGTEDSHLGRPVKGQATSHDIAVRDFGLRDLAGFIGPGDAIGNDGPMGQLAARRNRGHVHLSGKRIGHIERLIVPAHQNALGICTGTKGVVISGWTQDAGAQLERHNFRRNAIPLGGINACAVWINGYASRVANRGLTVCRAKVAPRPESCRQ